MKVFRYDKSYLDNVMTNLGAMMDYGVHSLGYSPSQMYSKFISSGIASYIEKGHPRYLSGLSGIELALLATGDTGTTEDFAVFPGAEYWAGWAIAYLQWVSGHSFSELALLGMDIDNVLGMYNPYHEADITKFSADAREIMDRAAGKRTSRLIMLRKAAGLTQMELSEKSGLALRTIRSYEQNSRSIQKAEAEKVLRLCKVLGCSPEYILTP